MTGRRAIWPRPFAIAGSRWRPRSPSDYPGEFPPAARRRGHAASTTDVDGVAHQGRRLRALLADYAPAASTTRV